MTNERTVKQKSYYKLGETVGMKGLDCNGIVIELNIPEKEVTLKYLDGIGEVTLKLWEIYKLVKKSVHTARASTKPLGLPTRKTTSGTDRIDVNDSFGLPTWITMPPGPSGRTVQFFDGHEIPIKYLIPFDPVVEGKEGFYPLQAIAQGDWIDLRAASDTFLKEGESTLIPLGVAMQLPEGYEAIIAPRGSTFLKWGILQTNGIGVVDNSYCSDEDEWKMAVYATHQVFIGKGSRICQFRIQKIMGKVNFTQVETLGNPTRGGFGSTGH